MWDSGRPGPTQRSCDKCVISPQLHRPSRHGESAHRAWSLMIMGDPITHPSFSLSALSLFLRRPGMCRRMISRVCCTRVPSSLSSLRVTRNVISLTSRSISILCQRHRRRRKWFLCRVELRTQTHTQACGIQKKHMICNNVTSTKVESHWG